MIEAELRRFYDRDRLWCDFQTTYAANEPAHRAQLRQAVLEKFEVLGLELPSDEKERMRDLTRPLTHAGDYFISLSHSYHLGGFLIADAPCGLDVETENRIKDIVVQRVSRESELREAPSGASLWGAKEATFKALHAYRQPLAQSRIEIGDWSTASRTEIFRLRNAGEFAAPSGRGSVMRRAQDVIATFVFTA